MKYNFLLAVNLELQSTPFQMFSAESEGETSKRARVLIPEQEL